MNDAEHNAKCGACGGDGVARTIPAVACCDHRTPVMAGVTFTVDQWRRPTGWKLDHVYAEDANGEEITRLPTHAEEDTIEEWMDSPDGYSWMRDTAEEFVANERRKLIAADNRQRGIR